MSKTGKIYHKAIPLGDYSVKSKFEIPSQSDSISVSSASISSGIGAGIDLIKLDLNYSIISLEESRNVKMYGWHDNTTSEVQVDLNNNDENVWLKIDRMNNLYSGFYSLDNSNWILIDSFTNIEDIENRLFISIIEDVSVETRFSLTSVENFLWVSGEPNHYINYHTLREALAASGPL